MEWKTTTRYSVSVNLKKKLNLDKIRIKLQTFRFADENRLDILYKIQMIDDSKALIAIFQSGKIAIPSCTNLKKGKDIIKELVKTIHQKRYWLKNQRKLKGFDLLKLKKDVNTIKYGLKKGLVGEERQKEYRKSHYKLNKEKISRREKEYYEKNKENIQKYNKKHYKEKCKDPKYRKKENERIRNFRKSEKGKEYMKSTKENRSELASEAYANLPLGKKRKLQKAKRDRYYKNKIKSKTDTFK